MTRQPTRGRTALALVAASLLFAGCGSQLSERTIAQAETGRGTNPVSQDSMSGGGQGGASGSTTGAATGTGADLVTGGTATGGSATGGTTGGISATSGSRTSGGTTSGSSAADCAGAGDPVVIGQSTTASGLVGQNVGSAVPTLQAWAKYINSQGGLACHPVRVISLDDASDSGKAQANVEDLVQNQKAVVLVANFVPLSISGFRAGVDKTNVPAIGGDLFTPDWWADPLLYPVGTNTDATAYGGTASVASRGGNKVAIMYCLEASFCPSYRTAVQNYAPKGGYSVVYSAQVSLTQPDFTSQCQGAKNAGATQISNIVDASAVSRIARSCATLGYYPKMAIAALAASFDQNDANLKKATVTLGTQAAPWFDSGIPAQKLYLETMSRYAPTLQLNPASSLAWAAAMMLKKAVDTLGPSAKTSPLTTALIRTGLAKIRNETLDGMVAPTTFSATSGNNPKNMCYFPVIFDGTFTAANKGYQCLT
jgi:branched-chain amino acid transport system substrate-binding protein